MINNEPVFKLSQDILNNSDLTGAIVFGGQRSGKSSYGLQVMYDIYQDWDIVLDHVLFRLEDVVGYLAKLITEDKVDEVVMWDDAGVYGSSQLYFTKKQLAQYLQALFDTIGSNLKGVILTTPSPENLLKALRGYEFFRIKITHQNQFYRRIGTGYRNVLLPSGTRFIRKTFLDTFDVRIPDEVYARYMVKRKGYLKATVGDLQSYLEEMGLAEKEKKLFVHKEKEDL